MRSSLIVSQEESGETHPKCGITTGVSRFRPESESWIPVDITIRNDRENASGSEVLESTKRESSARLQMRGHRGAWMRLSVEGLPHSLTNEVSSTPQPNPTSHGVILQMSRDMSQAWGRGHRDCSLIIRW
jgi:hypothetical protein